MKSVFYTISILLLFSITGCSMESTPESTPVPAVTSLPTQAQTIENLALNEPLSLSITLDDPVTLNGISLDGGGDVDTIPVEIEGVVARQSGSGLAIKSADGNTVPDSYLQFNLDDVVIFMGSPVGRVRLEVDYLDEGTDSFSLQYDAKPTGGSDGAFAGGGAVVKTGSGDIKTASFTLCDAHFANRVNGGDFRISDDNNGAEIIREVRVFGVESNIVTVHVDDFGANPLDNLPDSEANHPGGAGFNLQRGYSCFYIRCQ